MLIESIKRTQTDLPSWRRNSTRRLPLDLNCSSSPSLQPASLLGRFWTCLHHHVRQFLKIFLSHHSHTHILLVCFSGEHQLEHKSSWVYEKHGSVYEPFIRCHQCSHHYRLKLTIELGLQIMALEFGLNERRSRDWKSCKIESHVESRWRASDLNVQREIKIEQEECGRKRWSELLLGIEDPFWPCLQTCVIT